MAKNVDVCDVHARLTRGRQLHKERYTAIAIQYSCLLP